MLALDITFALIFLCLVIATFYIGNKVYRIIKFSNLVLLGMIITLNLGNIFNAIISILNAT